MLEKDIKIGSSSFKENNVTVFDIFVEIPR